MTQDASFEDSFDQPLQLKAQDAEDLTVLSALCQDAVVPMGEISYDAQRRQFALLLNRFRWEDQPRAEARGRDVERVQSVLLFDDVLSAQSSGLSATETDTIISVLSIAFEAETDGMGRFEITLAGDGAISLNVEALNITLKDVTRPYLAPSKKAPNHKPD
jgi:hypothetical protein